ncbi:hypothetical protein [Microbacterium foliorum]|uniref:hypothetical protein n=1 Tax=Microbacterium foliorum TaxID=104336 RepID=UPI00099FBDE8|nr:hypothetical protein [Microbacterium foliorum]AQY01614.1 hypothetical protein B2G67_09140 [Microbacterium foliorum]
MADFTIYAYTGKLTDFREAPIMTAFPRLWVQPARDAFSPTGPSAAKRVPVTLESDGTFSVNLVASIDMTPPTAYSLRCDWFDSDDALRGWSEWAFTAQPGGGPISTMPNKLTRVWYATTQPPVDRSGIYWIHPVTDEVKEWI